MTTKRDPIHPGEILLEEFLKPMGLSQKALAQAIKVPTCRIGAVVRCRRPITAEMTLRLGRYWGMSAEFWVSLQRNYDLEVARDAIQSELDSIDPMPPLPEYDSE